MKPLNLRAGVIASIAFLLSSTQGASPVRVPSANLDLSALGQVALAGNFDTIEVYEYQGQVEGFSNNGSTSILSGLPNGAFQMLASTDASINAMVPFVMADGTLAGIVVGGNFTSIGGISASAIALFNPTDNSITPLPGIRGEVTALLCVKETSTVYVGGSFEAANSTNAVAWVGSTGWANLEFAGFNAPVTSITQAPNGHIVFGGSFSGLGNVSTPTGTHASAQVINLSSANITTLESTGAAGFRNPNNVVCPSKGTDGPSSTWLLADQVAGWWRAEMGFGYNPTRLRLWNTNQDGRGTKSFRFVENDSGGIMNLTYTDASGSLVSCDQQCPLSHNASNPYQDFDFVNVIGMNGFTIEILDWYGMGAGLDGIELFQDDIFVYADNAFNEPTCSGAEFPSNATTSGVWAVTPSGGSTNDYLAATTTPANYVDTSVTFQPDIKTKNNYTVTVYTPGCLQDSSCASRGVVTVSGTLTSGGQPFTTQIFQTNQYEKYDQVYLGEVDAASSSFRPSVTITPSPGQSNTHFVASRVGFGQLQLTEGLNGLFEYNPNLQVADTDFSHFAIDNAGTELHPGAQINALITHDSTIYAAGSFSDDIFENIMAFKNNNATSLPGNGLNGAVSSMYTTGDFLYVGGNFTKTSSGSVTGLNNSASYQYSTDAWVPLGAGLDGPVDSVVPLWLNITANTPEVTIAFSGSFRNILASGSFQTVAAPGLAVWVPSRKNWLQNVNVTSQSLSGKLSSYVDVPNGAHLVAGDLQSAGWGISGVAGLSSSSGNIALEQLPVKIGSSSAQASKKKRAASAQRSIPSGVNAGLYYDNGGRNVTVFAGHFTATATNGSTIQNLLFLNGSDNNNVAGLTSAIDSNSTFLALALQDDLLFAGGSVSGQVGDAQIDGLVVYDLHEATYRSPQPAALVGANVIVNAMALKPSTTQVYIGGSFEMTAQQLQCASVCMYDTALNQWNTVGSNLDGTVTALFWSSSQILLATGNLTIGANGTSEGNTAFLASYDTKQQTWKAINNSGIPGPITTFAPASQDGSNAWIAGTAQNGSTFLININGNDVRPVPGAFADGTTVRGLQVIGTNPSHGSSEYLDTDQTLLVTGQLSLKNSGNCSAAVFNGTAFTPLILSSMSNGGAGSISQVFTSKTNPLKASHQGHSEGITILIALCAALGTIFLIILLGLILERIQRRRAGYSHVPQQVPYKDKNSNISRVPPERLFGSLGNGKRSPPHV